MGKLLVGIALWKLCGGLLILLLLVALVVTLSRRGAPG